MTLLSRRKILAATACGSVAGLGASTPQMAAGAAPTIASSGVLPVHDNAVRPESYGAIPDGKTDCTAAFLAAIAAATRSNYIAGRQRNQPIVLSAGVYRLTQPIHFSSTDMLIIGAGRQNSLLLIDHDGPGVVVDSGGNMEFRGIVIGSSDARKRKGGSGDGFVCQPHAGTNFTYFLSLIDFGVSDQPNNGIAIYDPEGLRMENVHARNNGGDGCLIDSRGLEDICNKIDFARFAENGGCGLNVMNVANSIFSRVECHNNRGMCQLRLQGNYNTIEYTDCEGNLVYNGTKPAIGVILSGKGNIIQGGDFFQLSNAISLQNAHDCRVIMPKLEGAGGAPLLVGVDIGPDCERNMVDYVDGHLTTTRVRDRGVNSRVTAGGVTPLAEAMPTAVQQHASDMVAPDLSAGHTVSLVADGPLRIDPPVNARSGAIFTLMIDTQAHGLDALTFAEAYRGVADHIAANADRRYLTCAFVAAPDGRCMPHSLFSYD